MPLGAKFLERMGDYVLWYAKDINLAAAKYRQLYLKQDVSGDFHWNWYELADGTRKKRTKTEIDDEMQIPQGAKVLRLVSMWPPSFSANAVFAVDYRGKKWRPVRHIRSSDSARRGPRRERCAYRRH